jgi:hypothetical protein
MFYLSLIEINILIGEMFMQQWRVLERVDETSHSFTCPVCVACFCRMGPKWWRRWLQILRHSGVYSKCSVTSVHTNVSFVSFKVCLSPTNVQDMRNETFSGSLLGLPWLTHSRHLTVNCWMDEQVRNLRYNLRFDIL